MNEIKLSDLLQLARPGDIGLSENPDGLGKGIKWFQEMAGDEAQYTHAFIFKSPHYSSKPELRFPRNQSGTRVKRNTLIKLSEMSRHKIPMIDIGIYEAYKQITCNPLFDYLDKNILVMRHKKMSDRKYKKGVKEIEDNLGQTYPYHRLILHAVDSGINWVLKKLNIKWKCKSAYWLSTDWPVCSELATQFLLEAGVKTKLAGGEKWQGVQPDDLHDAALKYSKYWKIIFEGKLIDG